MKQNRKKYRRLGMIGLSLALLLSICFPMQVFAATIEKNITEGDFEYTLYDDGTALVTKYLNNEETAVIPETITSDKTYIVTRIGEKAFLSKSGLTFVNFPNTIEAIGNSAFQGCKNLTSFTMPTNLKKIGNYAFVSCYKLNISQLPKNLTSIGSGAFQYCYSLQSITIPENTTSIGESSFAACSELKNVTILSKITNLPYGIFIHCTNLETVFLPESINIIAAEAFRNCTSLKNITLPNNVKYIYASAFENCSVLESISLPNSLTGLVSNPFSNCPNLKEININDNPNLYISDGVLYSIEQDTGKKTLVYYPINKTNTSFLVPSDVSSISMKAFFGNTYLTTLTIPDNVTYISSDAFQDCTSITHIDLPQRIKSINSATFQNLTSLKSITLPNSVSIIESMAFANCSSLVSVTIPNSVTYIHQNAFINCTKLKTVIMSNTGLSVYGDQFKNTALSNVLVFCPDKDSDLSYLKSIILKSQVNPTIYKGVLTPKSVFEKEVEIGTTLNLKDLMSLRVFDENGMDTTLPSDFATDFDYGFSFSGNNSNKTYIKNDILHIGDDETSRYLTIDIPGGGSETLSLLKGIEVTTPPTKTIYRVGETMDAKGIKVSKVYADGSTTDLGISFTQQKIDTVGYIDFVISTDCGQTYFTFTVLPNKPDALTIKSPSTKKTYREGELFDPIGMEVELQQDNNSILLPITEENKDYFSFAPALNTPIKKGQKEIEISYLGMNAKQTIDVVANYADNISLNQTNYTLSPGRKITLKAVLQPINTFYKNITWTSSDEKIASVNANGEIIALAPGTAIITAQAQGGKTAHCVITIKDNTKPVTPPNEKPNPSPSDKSTDSSIKDNSISNSSNSTKLKTKTTQNNTGNKISKQDNKKEFISKTNSNILLAKATAKKTTNKISWFAIAEADGYVIYGAKCGEDYKPLKTIKDGSSNSWTKKKRKKNTSYKYFVKAYKEINGKKEFISTSNRLHVVTKGSQSTNAKTIQTTFSKTTLKVNETIKVTPTIIFEEENKKPIAHTTEVRYQSSDSSIAKVSKNGKIKAIGSGKCYIYVYANNGVYKKITVTVE